MKNDIYKKTVRSFPEFFDMQLQTDSQGSGIFEPLRKIIDFDEAYIFFLNPDSIRLKYLFGENRKFKVDTVLIINKKIQSDLFSQKSFITDVNNPLIKLLKLENNNSFLISKLIIKNTVYGFILLCNKQKSFYPETNIDIMNAIGPIISYNIKDLELSEVFKAQLKALKDSIIETKSAYKTIEEQNIKILETDKVKTEFLANISHELRTPLNAIIGFSEILSNQFYGTLNEKQSEFIQDINVSGIHLLGMINEILDISKIEAKAMSLNKTEFSILRATEEVVNIVKPLTDKKAITIKKNISEDKMIYADFQKIRQILYNLLSNAIKFSPENETIYLDIYFNRNSLIIKIKDNGIGISLENQNKIFEKFVQLENTYTKKESSTGLGLTITKELVEMHKGKIIVESDIGKGATFIINIPLKRNLK